MFAIILLVLFVMGIGMQAALYSSRKEAKLAENKSPLPAKVVSVRKHYVTFEFDNGDRLELLTPEYGTYVVGDSGMLLYGKEQVVSWTRDKAAMQS